VVLCAPSQWEASDKKLAIVGYSAAALVALYVVESLIHLPVLNVVGFFSYLKSIVHHSD
jgi:hypothetical protein